MRNFNIKVNGKSFFVEVEEAAAGAQAAPVKAEVIKHEPAAAAPAAAAREAGSVSVISPLPGLILRLVVANGSVVKKNDKILVIEAMKMEHEIVAGADGKIAFLVKNGDSVETGAELAYIK